MPDEKGMFTNAEVNEKIEAALKDRESRDKNKQAASEAEKRATAAEAKLAQIEAENAKKTFTEYIKEKNIKLEEKKVEELFKQTKGDIELLKSMMTILGEGHEQKTEFNIHGTEAKVKQTNKKETPVIDKDDPDVSTMLQGE